VSNEVLWKPDAGGGIFVGTFPWSCGYIAEEGAFYEIDGHPNQAN
jgi:hypothetical protein